MTDNSMNRTDRTWLKVGFASSVVIGIVIGVWISIFFWANPFAKETSVPHIHKRGEIIYGYLNQKKSIDGDTFWLTNPNQKIRLWGIDAPELKQTCTAQSRDWNCGMSARDALIDMVRNDKLSCELKTKDGFNRWISICKVRGITINSWMVEHGWALAYTKFSKDYLEEQKRAEAKKVGIWKGVFVNPEDWRRETKRKLSQ